MWAVPKFVLALRHNLHQPNDTGSILLLFFNLCHVKHGARPYESCKICKGWPLRDAPSKLVQLWYKTFPTDHGGQIEMKTATTLYIKPVPHDLVRRIRFWTIKSPEQDFKYLYWTISKILFWNLLTCTARSVEDETRNGHRNAKRNPNQNHETILLEQAVPLKSNYCFLFPSDHILWVEIFYYLTFSPAV